jgi:peptide/nickel transport system permease protein
VTFDVLPVAGRGGADSYVLPVLALALGPAALLARIVRVETHRVLDENFIQTARAKRLPPMRIYVRHVLPNALAATLTVAGLVLASLIAGTVLVENIFAWPGLGTSLVQSIVAKDYPMVQGLALVFGSSVLIINTAVDLMLALFDPRSTMVDT